MITWMRKNMRTILIVLVVVFAASIFYGLGIGGFRRGRRDEGRGKKILAKVNGKEVSILRYQQILSRILQDYKEELKPSDLAFLENLALGQAIDFELLLSEARKKVRVSGREIDATLNNIMQAEKFSSKKEFEAALKRMNLSLSRFKELLKEEILVQKLIMRIREAVKLAPEDLREIKASHILVSDEADAKNLLEKIKKGENFGKLAKEYSLDPSSKGKGGDLGYFTTGMMVPPFEKAAFSLKVGGVSEVVKTQFGYHLIKVTDSRLRKFPKDVKDIEKAALAEKQEKAFRSWYSEIRSKAKFEVVDPVFRGHLARFSGRAEEALAEYNKALRMYPTNSYLHIYLGDTYEGLGKADLAISEYEKAVEVEGGNPNLYIVLGNAYKRQKKGDLALKSYQKASLIAGDNKSLHEKLLKIFKEVGSSKDIFREQSEIKRLEKKEKFEKELRGEKH